MTVRMANKRAKRLNMCTKKDKWEPIPNYGGKK